MNILLLLLYNGSSSAHEGTPFKKRWKSPRPVVVSRGRFLPAGVTRKWGALVFCHEMNKTTLLYLEQFTLLQSPARVIEVLKENDRDVLVLDRTIFYPQGGGQPYDTGIIQSSSGKFIVEEVRFVDGAVRHIGNFESGGFAVGEQIMCRVDAGRRELHARIHSAGHLVDKAIAELEPDWKPRKGYHFPQGPYDEYEGSLEGRDKEKLKMDIEKLCNTYVEKGGATQVIFMTREKMKEACRYAPDFPQTKGELARVVIHDGYFMPCGGTPVADLSEIGRIVIRKIKQEGKNIRVGYDVAR